MGKMLLTIFITISTLAFSIPNSFANESIKVLSLNTWMIPLFKSDEKFHLRKKGRVRSKLIGKYSQAYDLILLQEVFCRKQRRIIAREINKGQEFENRYQTTPFFKVNAGVFNLSKYKIIKSSFKRFSTCKGEQCLSAKGILHIRVKLKSGVEIDVFNTHLQAFKSGRGVREVQLQEALAHIKEINGGKRIAIFAGDLNVSAGGSEYPDINEKLLADGFNDAWTLANGDAPGYTWDSYINTWSRYIDTDHRSQHRFDYIFIRDGKSESLSVIGTKVVFKEPLALKPNGEKFFLSDHFGVELEFKVKSKI